jgi:hypothetical protein
MRSDKQPLKLPKLCYSCFQPSQPKHKQEQATPHSNVPTRHCLPELRNSTPYTSLCLLLMTVGTGLVERGPRDRRVSASSRSEFTAAAPL